MLPSATIPFTFNSARAAPGIGPQVPSFPGFGLARRASSPGVVDRHLRDLPERVRHLGPQVHDDGRPLVLPDRGLDVADPAGEHPGQFAGRDRQPDLRLVDAGDRDPDQPAPTIDHRPAGVPRVQVAVQLHGREFAVVVLAEAGDRPLADRQGRVAEGRGQVFAEREAEHVHGQGLGQRGLLRVQGGREVLHPLDAADAEDGQVADAVGGDQLGLAGELVLAAAVEDEFVFEPAGRPAPA